MKKLISLILFIFILSPIKADNYSIKEYIEKLILAKHYGVDSINMIMKSVQVSYNKLDSSDVFFEFVSGNYSYAYSLLLYVVGDPEHIAIEKLSDVEKILTKKKEEYFNLLINNEKYVNSIKYYLNSKTNQQFESKLDTIKLDKLIEIASKYYFVHKLTNEDEVLFSFCGGGANPYLLLPELSTNIVAEAFSWQALIRPLIQRNFRHREILYNEIEPMLVDTLTKMDNLILHQDKLKIIREISWNYVENLEWIEKLLLAEFKLSKDIIPIVVVN